MILDGKSLAVSETKKLAAEIKNRPFTPGLATVLVGEDPASRIYVGAKMKACAEAGIASFPLSLPASISTEGLLGEISKLNARKDVHGILVQLPLPAHIDEEAVIEAIAPSKDVDCFHPFNIGRLFSGYGGLIPCTPAGILHLIGTVPLFSLEGKKALMIGASNIVGKPMGILLLNKKATLTVAHKATKDLKELCLWADIIISATGVPRLIKGSMVNEGTVLIDVGIHRSASGEICGDFDFSALKDKALALTPVPGGVGPMTILYLLKNTLGLADLLEA